MPTKPCPKCGKKMSLATYAVWGVMEGIGTETPRVSFWWCGCGRKEFAGVALPYKEHRLREQWEQANAD